MSTILKALRQLESETPPDSVDPFGAVVEPDPNATPARKAKPQRRGAAGMGLGIGLAGAGLLLIGLALQPMFRTSTPSVAAAGASSTAPSDADVAVEQPVQAAAPSKPRMPAASVAILSQPEATPPNEAAVVPAEEATSEVVADETVDTPIAVVATVSEEPVQQLAERFAAANAQETPEAAAQRPVPVAGAKARTGPGASGETAVAFIPAAVETAKASEVEAAAPVQKPVVVAAAVPVPAPTAVSTPPKVAAKPASQPVREAAGEVARKVAAEVAPKPAAEVVKLEPEVPAVVRPSVEVATQTPEAAEVVLDRAVPDFEEVRRPLDPPVLFPVRTSWHPKAERREARLEAVSGQAQVVREGDEVDGYTVLEISPSAVVFERGGETVRVRVGGS